jgi:DnaJ family protein C protein 28
MGYRAIEEIIRNAMEQGEFDDLAGKGKPIKFDENPYEDPGWRLAYSILRQNGFAPDWIEIRREIESELAEERSRLVRSWDWRTQALAAGEDPRWVADEWQRALSLFKDKIGKLNSKVKNFNVRVPSLTFSRALLDVEVEISNLTGEDI